MIWGLCDSHDDLTVRSSIRNRGSQISQFESPFAAEYGLCWPYGDLHTHTSFLAGDRRVGKIKHKYRKNDKGKGKVESKDYKPITVWWRYVLLSTCFFFLLYPSQHALARCTHRANGFMCHSIGKFYYVLSSSFCCIRDNLMSPHWLRVYTSSILFWQVSAFLCCVVFVNTH